METPVDYDDELVPTSIYHTKQYNVTVASNCIATEVHKRNDIAIETTFLKDDGVMVNRRETTMILKINCVDACVRRHWLCSINAVVARRRVLVPCLRDDQDVELLVDDVMTHTVVLLPTVCALMQPIDTSLQSADSMHRGRAGRNVRREWTR